MIEFALTLAALLFLLALSPWLLLIAIPIGAFIFWPQLLVVLLIAAPFLLAIGIVYAVESFKGWHKARKRA